MNKVKELVARAQGEKEEVEPIIPKEYGCEILLENTTLEKVKDPSFPYDAYLVWYKKNGKECLDLTRCCKKTNLFDMYYDAYGPNSLQRIDFGFGKISPKMWGYKKPEKRKRK